jgi:aminoglycoside phosphotransferase (APT) family kinase protein
VSFAVEPAALGRGFDTFIYGFQLAAGGDDGAWNRPLVARIYGSTGERDKAQCEAAVQRFASSLGYPALEPLAIETEDTALGLPMMLMPRIDGRTLLERITSRPWSGRGLLRRMAELHVQLHKLPVAGCPLPYDSPLVDRRIADFHDRISRHGLDDLSTGLAWLEQHCDVVRDEEISLCHNDFHPLNVLAGDDGTMTVIDWTDAALGDRHHDLGRTLALFWFAYIAATSSVERGLLRAVRGLLRSWYFERYRALLPVDARRLRYWEALQTFSGWLQLRELEVRDVADAGSQPEMAQNIAASVKDEVQRYFWKQVELAPA